MNNVSKILATLAILSMSMSSITAQPRTSAEAGALEVTITGEISHTDYKPGQSGTVTFSRFPATVAEFEQVREQIGGEPHGAVALQIMAYEMFRRDRTVGEACIRMNSTTVNVMTPLNRLKELFGNDVNYAKPYQIAAFLKDANAENGYTPSKPYTVEVRVHKVNPYKHNNTYQATQLYLEILTQGKDKGVESFEVVKTLKPGEPGEGKYFIVEKCAGVYSSVKNISFSTPFNGLD
ncbi:MAG: hypothetical protein FWG84_01990 [Bacteroidales bacterium]|nr:hypothetical protein [Bacteroidales bacterium]